METEENSRLCGINFTVPGKDRLETLIDEAIFSVDDTAFVLKRVGCESGSAVGGRWSDFRAEGSGVGTGASCCEEGSDLLELALDTVGGVLTGIFASGSYHHESTSSD